MVKYEKTKKYAFDLRGATVMKRRYKAGRFFYASLAAVTAVTAAAPMTVNASTSTANFDMRKKVVDLLGILSVTDYSGQVTRSEFAKMLVNASSYRENLPVSSVSVFAAAKIV